MPRKLPRQDIVIRHAAQGKKPVNQGRKNDQAEPGDGNSGGLVYFNSAAEADDQYSGKKDKDIEGQMMQKLIGDEGVFKEDLFEKLPQRNKTKNIED